MSLITDSFLQSAGYDVYFRSAELEGSGDYSSLGVIENNDEFKFTVRKHMEYFTGAAFGKTELDAIYNGKKVLLSMVLQEINRPACLELCESETGGVPLNLGQPGTVASSVSGQLQIVPHYSNLPALTVATKKTLYLENFCVEDQHEIERMLRSGRSVIPLVLNIMPWIDAADSNEIKFGKWTDAVDLPA